MKEQNKSHITYLRLYFIVSIALALFSIDLILAVPLLAKDPKSPIREEMIATLKDAAISHVLQVITSEYDVQGRERDVEAIDFRLAELDGNTPQEAVVYVRFHIGEGCRDYYLVIYSTIDLNNPQLIASRNTHGEYMDEGYIEIVDLDKNGEDEILVVGDTEGMVSSDISIYTLKDNTLKDIIQGLECGVEYFRLNIDEDREEEILAIGVRHKNTSQEIYLNMLKKDRYGHYSEVSSPKSPGDLMVWVFEEVVSAGQINRPSISLGLLIQGIRQNGKIPNRISSLQTRLEKLYHDERYQWDYHVFVNAMAWPGNTTAIPFLRILLTSKNKGDTRAQAAEALAIIEGKASVELSLTVLKQQLVLPAGGFDHDFVLALVESMLSVGDRRGLKIVENRAKNPATDIQVRQELVFWVLGNIALLPETEFVLLDFAFNSTDAEIRRLAAACLTHLDFINSQLTFEDLVAGLEHPDENVRGDIALALEDIGQNKAVPVLMKSLERERNPETRRKMVLALNYLNTKEIVELYSRLLPQEKNDRIREMMFWKMKKAGYHFSKKDIAEGLGPSSDARTMNRYIEFVAEQELVEFLPRIRELAQKGQGNFVRTNAIRALGYFDFPESKNALREILATDSDWLVRSSAIESLGRLKDIEAEELLIKILREDQHDLVRAGAARTLGLLGTERAQKVLNANFLSGLHVYPSYYIDAFVLTNSSNMQGALANQLARLEPQILTGESELKYHVLVYLADGLRRMGDQRGLEAMLRWVKPEYPEILRVQATEYLGEKHIWRAASLIQKYINDESREVRIAVIKALKKLEQTDSI